MHVRIDLVEQWEVPSFEEEGEPGTRPEVTHHRAMAGVGSATPSYPGVAELTRQLDQEKIAMLSKRVDDLRNQNQDLKVNAQSCRSRFTLVSGIYLVLELTRISEPFFS